MSGSMYFWHDNQVWTKNWGDDSVLIFFVPCIDTSVSRNRPKLRYGQFKPGGDWTHTPLEDMPVEFRAHLLLLGVPT